MNQKGFVQPLLIVIIGVIVLGGGFVVMRNFGTPRRMPPVIRPAPSPSPSPTPAPSPTPSPLPTPAPSPTPSPAPSPSATQDKPRGIYVLDTAGGTYRDKNIRDYDFVTGYAWRMGWGSFETAKGVYDFSSIDHIIGKLQPINKKLTIWLVEAFKMEPAYIVATPGVVTWSDTAYSKGVPTTRPVPWDPYVQDRFQAFTEALGDHKVADASGKLVPLRDHPTLTMVQFGVAGLGSIAMRAAGDPSISSLAGYTREGFKAAIQKSLRATTQNFPNKFVHTELAARGLKDSSPSDLLEEIRLMIVSEFGNKVGFFDEGLAASKDSSGIVKCYPETSSGTAIAPYRSKDMTFVTFQMLQSWINPFFDKNKTLNAIPTDGIKCGYDVYGATYFEVYAPDIDNQDWHDEFREWDNILK